MKRVIICLLALAFCGVNGYAQRNDLVPYRATYYTAEEGIIMRQDNFTYDEYDSYLTEKLTTIEDVVNECTNVIQEVNPYL